MTSLFTFVLAVLTLGVINAEIKWTCSVLEPWNVVFFFFLEYHKSKSTCASSQIYVL